MNPQLEQPIMNTSAVSGIDVIIPVESVKVVEDVDMDMDNIDGSIELKEYVNMNALRIIRDNFETVYERMGHEFWKYNSKTRESECVDYTTAFTIINDYYIQKSRSPMIQYKYTARSTYGRRFATSTSLQGMCRALRHTIAKDKMTDIDMKNAHPTFLLNLCKKLNFTHPVLEKYIEKRDECLESWINTDIGQTFDKKTNKTIKNTKITTKDQAKEYFLKVINGGGNYKTSSTELNEFFTCHQGFLETFYQNKDYKKYRKQADNSFLRDKKEGKKDNRKGACLNLYMCDIENRALNVIEKYLQDKDIEYGALCFDGIMIYSSSIPDVKELLIALEKVLLKSMGFTIRLAVKEMNESIDISDLKKKEDIDISDVGYALYFLKHEEGNYMFQSETQQLYYYEVETCLWERRHFRHLRTLLPSVLEAHIKSSPNPDIINTQLEEIHENRRLTALVQTCIPYIEKRRDDAFIQQHFDNIPGLFPLADNKVIELSTGIVRERRKEDYFTKTTTNSIVSVTPSEKEEVLKYYSSMLKTEDPLYRDCLIMDMAYILTGENNQKAIINLLGPKDGGKSLFLTIHTNILSTFCASVNKRLLVTQKNTSVHDSELFNLLGKRLGTISELSEKERFNVTLLKAISGRDKINIRGAGEKATSDITFNTVLVVATNEIAKYDDEAFESRLRYYDFKNKFERDDTFAQHILGMSNIFLTVITEYAKQFYDNGRKLLSCQQLIDFTNKQNANKNPLLNWIKSEGFEPGTSKEWIETSTLYDEYKTCCIDNGWDFLGKSNFYKAFEKALGLGDPVKIKFKRNGIETQIRGYRELKRDSEPGEENQEESKSQFRL